MSGTKLGGFKAKKANLKHNKFHYQNMGHLGGIAKVKKGFAMMDPEKHR